MRQLLHHESHLLLCSVAGFVRQQNGAGTSTGSRDASASSTNLDVLRALGRASARNPLARTEPSKQPPVDRATTVGKEKGKEKGRASVCEF